MVDTPVRIELLISIQLSLFRRYVPKRRCICFYQLIGFTQAGMPVNAFQLMHKLLGSDDIAA